MSPITISRIRDGWHHPVLRITYFGIFGGHVYYWGFPTALCMRNASWLGDLFWNESLAGNGVKSDGIDIMLRLSGDWLVRISIIEPNRHNSGKAVGINHQRT